MFRFCRNGDKHEDADISNVDEQVPAVSDVDVQRSRLQEEPHLSVMVMEDDGHPHSQSEPDSLPAVDGSERLVHRLTSRTSRQPSAQLSESQPGLSI